MNDIEMNSPLILKYQKVYEKDPSSRVFAPLGEAYRKLGMIDEAMGIIRQGLKRHPSYSLALLVLASCYVDKKQFNLAYTTIRETVSENLDNLRLQRLFGKICIELGNDKEALDTYKYLLFINPKDSDVAKQVEFLESKKNFDISKDTDKNNENFSYFDLSNLNSSLNKKEKISSSPDGIDEWIQVDLTNQKDNEQEVIENYEDGGSNIKQIVIDVENEKNEEKNVLESRYLNGTKFLWEKVINKNDSIDDEIPDLTTTKKINESEEIDEPVITHTLVDLYCEQGYLNKAVEILEKILLLNPDDTKTLKKLEHVKQLIAKKTSSNSLNEAKKNKSVDTNDEGRMNLMNLVDKKLNKSNIGRIERIENKYYEFLNELKNKADKNRDQK